MGAGHDILDALVFILHWFLDFILELCLGLYLGERKNCSAPSDKKQEEILCKSAVDLAKCIREGKLKSYEVVKAYYDRIKAINPELNAVVDGPFEEALEEASRIDKRLEAGDYSEEELSRKPFLGVVFTTKDSTEVAGKLHTLGLISRKQTRAKDDAECVRLLKESGAIILATTNIPEVNKWIESRNMLIGKTNNPYDFRRSAGGSSGGEASLVTACGTAIGLGTDIGGSTRIPAFNCGVFGHKPSVGTVNMRGCTFRTGEEKETMVVAGPICRHACDLLPVFKVIVDPRASAALKLDSKVDIKKLRYFYIPSNNMKHCNSVTTETQEVMNKIRNHFSSLTGRDVVLANLPHLELSGKLWRYWMTQEPANFNLLLGNGVELNPFVELFKKLIGRSEFTMAAIYSLIDGLLPKEKERKMRSATEECKKVLQDLLGDDGVLFFHSSPRTAPFHYYNLMKFQDFSYFSIFNVLHVPATQVPMGLDSRGLPLGIQVVATEMNDRLCLAVAMELEKAFGGWVAPFKRNY